jgi:8-oxo-dGTP pyrophosphatase MutT (NUDIX family)
MSHEATIHPVQTHILRQLLFLPNATYSQLQKETGLDSDHFKFHTKRLAELGLIEKHDRSYTLSSMGKEYANKLDTDHNTIERQPKSAVLLGVEKRIDGEPHFLFQERLKHPYFGYWGIMGGKIRWGETILEAAARELMEETGLMGELRYVGVYHEHTFQKESGELLEDKIFHIVHCTNPSGVLTEEFEGGRNEWMSVDKARSLTKRFDSFDTELNMILDNEQFIERQTYYSKADF